MTAKVNEVVEAYIKLRDHKEALEKQHKDEMAPIKERMHKLEVWMQRELQKQGVDSFKTSSGTAFLQERVSATVEDWQATLGFILDTEDYAFLEARVAKSVVRDYVESHGAVPPGVKFTKEQVVRFRR